VLGASRWCPFVSIASFGAIRFGPEAK